MFHCCDHQPGPLTFDQTAPSTQGLSSRFSARSFLSSLTILPPLSLSSHLLSPSPSFSPSSSSQRHHPLLDDETPHHHQPPHPPPKTYIATTTTLPRRVRSAPVHPRLSPPLSLELPRLQLFRLLGKKRQVLSTSQKEQQTASSLAPTRPRPSPGVKQTFASASLDPFLSSAYLPPLALWI